MPTPWIRSRSPLFVRSLAPNKSETGTAAVSREIPGPAAIENFMQYIKLFGRFWRCVGGIDRFVGLLGLITGLIFGAWGIYLSLDASKKNEEVSKILERANRNSLYFVYLSIISDEPMNGSDEMSRWTKEEQAIFLRKTYEKLQSESSNPFLVNDGECNGAFSDFQSYLFISTMMSQATSTYLANTHEYEPYHGINPRDYYTKSSIFFAKCIQK